MRNGALAGAILIRRVHQSLLLAVWNMSRPRQHRHTGSPSKTAQIFQKLSNFNCLPNSSASLALTLVGFRDERLEEFLDQVQSNCLLLPISLSDDP
jgi:hypothetical protein